LERVVNRVKRVKLDLLDYKDTVVIKEKEVKEVLVE